MQPMAAPPSTDDARRAVRRNRSKMCMRRYRANKKVDNAKLVDDVCELERSVVRLEATLSELHIRQGVTHCIAAISRYVELFQHGYSPTQVALAPMHRRQAAFLHDFAARNVNYNGEIGVQHVLNQWATYDALFGSLRAGFSRIDAVSVDDHAIVLEAAGFVDVVVTRAVVRALFPQLASRPDLMDKVLGSTLHLPLRVIFTHDAQSHRVTSMQATTSVVVALMGLLKSPNDVNVALGGALLDENLLLDPSCLDA